MLCELPRRKPPGLGGWAMDTEGLAVSAVSGLLARCPRLRATIATNDKTLFTDGHIDLFTGSAASKGEWAGRVSVQVKGRSRVGRKASSPTLSVPRTDLKAYQRQSGVLFFYVAIDPKSQGTTIYYALLSPYAIEQLLADEPDDGPRVTVTFKIFPEETEDIQRLIALAVETQKQSVEMGFDSELFGRVRSMTVHTATELNLDAPLELIPGSNDFAFVVHTIDGMSIPLNGTLNILPPAYVEHDMDVPISSGGVTFANATVRRLTEHSSEIRVSPGLVLEMSFVDSKVSFTATLTLEQILQDQLKTVQFYLGLIDERIIDFDGQASPLEVGDGSDAEDLRRHRSTLGKLAELFDYLGVDQALVDLGEITDDQGRKLMLLYHAFIDGQEINMKLDGISRILQPVGKCHLMLLAVPGASPDRWRFIDPFSTADDQQYRWISTLENEDRTIPITAYEAIDQEHLPTVLNMRLANIVDSYQSLAEHPDTGILANQMVLRLLRAADLCETRRSELLAAAGALNIWLIDHEGPETSHLLNNWQILRRSQGLASSDRTDIRALRRSIGRGSDAGDLELDLACALLLGDPEDIEDATSQLSVQQLAKMKAWPIWALYPEMSFPS